LSAELGIENKVLIMGKLSNAALKACYDETDVFLCASEHEGFCVPLIEAMRMGIPVIAYASSAIPETMGGSGILLSEKNPNVIGALLNEVISDRDLYEKIVTDQLERIARLKKADTPTILLRAIENIQNGVRQRTIQMQGPFESSYSLAIVNRKLMEAMDDLENDDVSIYCAEGPGDYMPKPADLKDKPHAKALWKKSHDMHYPDVVIRNMFPPRVADVRGGINLQLFGWEETRVPNMYVYGFNQYLNGIGTMSSFVSQTLKNCGLKIPVEPIGIGVDLPNGYDSIRPYSVKANAQTVFLHISSAFSRKGVDILLRAYFRAFSSDDSVCLIVKCFPNIHNKVEEQLNEINASHANPPAVELINLDIPTEELYSLYKAADCYVHVARGEGFGLTVAEAMLAHVPVIVSPNTGMADFCNKDTALLVDYKMVSAKTHLSDGSSMWAEPDENQLTEMLKQFHFSRDTLPVRETTENAYNLISTKFTWTAVAQRWSQFIDRIENEQYKPRIAMLSTWNNKCGIAEYTRMLCEHLGRRIELTVYPNHGVILESSDEDFVAPRLWHSAFIDDTDDLITVLKDSDHDIVHIQFNFGFFSLDGIERIIDELYKTKAIIISFHKTVDTVVNGKLRSFQSIRQSLNHCDALIVHQEADRDLLVEYGVHEKLISIIPLGQIVYDDPGREASRKKIGVSGSPVLGSYGFLLPNKGIKECIEAVSILRREHPNVLYLVRCALYEVHESSEYFNECKSLVESMGLERNVRFFVDFMDNEKSMEILHACDIMLSTYLPVSESASGAVRFCIAAQRPVITTRQAIFEEFEDCSEQIEQADPELIAAAVAKVRNPEVYDSYCKKMASHVDNTSWDNVCEKTHELYKKTDEARSKAYARME
jgi:glycosyltransferase involved in cell wall biosynthesis